MRGPAQRGLQGAVGPCVCVRAHSTKRQARGAAPPGAHVPAMLGRSAARPAPRARCPVAPPRLRPAIVVARLSAALAPRARAAPLARPTLRFVSARALSSGPRPSGAPPSPNGAIDAGTGAGAAQGGRGGSVYSSGVSTPAHLHSHHPYSHAHSHVHHSHHSAPAAAAAASASGPASGTPRTIAAGQGREARAAREAREKAEKDEKADEAKKPSKEELARQAAQRLRKRREAKEAAASTAEAGDITGRAVAFCSAFEYDIDSLLRHLAARGHRPVMHTSDCVSAHVPGRSGELVEVYYFQSGGFVMWGTGAQDPQEERMFIESVRPFERQAVSRVEDENMPYKDERTTERPHVSTEGVIMVAGSDAPPDGEAASLRGKDRLTCSYALLKSVQLSVLERAVEDLVRETRDVPSRLASVGSTRLSAKDINIRLGRVLMIRSQLNQYWEIQAAPDITWDTPVLEGLFGRLARQLDIQDRCYFLNQRLDYAKETLDLVRQSAAEKHSHFLEQIIIVLIAMELSFNIFPIKEVIQESVLSALQWFRWK